MLIGGIISDGFASRIEPVNTCQVELSKIRVKWLDLLPTMLVMLNTLEKWEKEVSNLPS